MATMLMWIAGAWCAASALVWLLVLRPFFSSVKAADAVMVKATADRPRPPVAIEPPSPVQAAGCAPSASTSSYQGLVLDRLCHHARQLTGAELSTLVIRDERSPGCLIVAATEGAGEEVIGDRIPADEGLAGLTGIRRGRPIAGTDYGRFAARGRALPAVHGGVSAPISEAGTVKGALSVATTDPARALADPDLALLTQITDLLGCALEHLDHRHELAGTVDAQVEALAAALATWDGQTAEHSEEVVRLARLVGRQLGLGTVDLLELELAARLHDVGKIRVPGGILRKPGALDQEERRLIEMHPAWGAELVARVPGLEAVALLVHHHHERPDGAGYPARLRGDRIPPAARVVACCDAYGAMTEDRPYRTALSHEAALEELRAGAGTQFDPQVVDALEVVVTPLHAVSVAVA